MGVKGMHSPLVRGFRVSDWDLRMSCQVKSRNLWRRVTLPLPYDPVDS